MIRNFAIKCIVNKKPAESLTLFEKWRRPT